MPFDAVIELSALDQSTGFRINGQAAFDFFGAAVSSAGDVNGDGIDDVIIGAIFNRTYSDNFAGASYVVFGSSAGFPIDLDLSDLDGTNGFRINGVAFADRTGYSVASAGDVNGDGFDDLIIGAPSGYAGVTGPGAAFVVFGGDTGFAAELDLSTLDGTQGFRISGVASYDLAGMSAASVGDINDDGIDDVIIGAQWADPNGAESGASYVVFGSSAGFAANLDLAALDGTSGFRIDGLAAGDYSGFSVASAGDMNGDGIDDLIVGARGAGPNATFPGASYVVFGDDAGFASSIDLAALNGTNGFRMDGASFDIVGHSVAAAGDVNGDGFDDVIVGGPGGRAHGNSTGVSYVVFGGSGGFAANLDLSTLNGTDGFRISGVKAGESSGHSVASAGDVNGDGFGDVIIGAWGSSNNGIATGASYVVFGGAAGFAANLDLSTLNGTNGFLINGAVAFDYLGWSVASAGDVNNDGIDDLIMGAREASPNAERSGAAFILYGRLDYAGSAGSDSRIGGVSHDRLLGLGGNDVLYGLGGDDLLDGGDLSDVLNGGDGGDDLLGGNGGDILNGDAGDDELRGNDGADKLFGGLGADDLLGGLSNDRLEGGDGNDDLSGEDGNDYLDGGAGSDTLAGGLGNDIYILAWQDYDTVVEAANAGYDIVRADREVTMADNIEGAELTGSGHNSVYGNALSNNIQGNSGENLLQGRDGVDTINGNDGDDDIAGGIGNDLLRGGMGADTFYLFDESIARAVLETDQIYDFSAAEGDLINLSFVDANTRLDGDQAFRLVSAFTRHDAANPELTGQMTLTFAGGITTLRLDVNGDARVDYQMKINGDVTADYGDWLL